MLRTLLPLLFLLLPLAEIACFILVGRRIGLLPTLSLVVLSAVAGIVLMRIQGFGVLTRLRRSGQDGHAPGKELLDAAMILIAGILLLIPGFISDIVGLALLFAGVPWAGVLALITMVLGIAQVPAFIVTLPAIIYIWSSGDYGTGMATTHTIILLIAGLADNVLKPLMLGRGVDAPMPVILFGALGGMASGGILGMFVGATLLALGYRLFMEWVAHGVDPTSSLDSNAASPR